MKYFGGKAPHRLTLYVEVLPSYVNKVNKATVCKACIEKLGREIAIERSTFTNTKACTKVHLRKYQNFFKKYTEEERNEILYESNSESQEINTVVSANSAISLSTNSSLIDNYLLRNLNPAEYIIFERHLLKSTISNGWAFRWTENPEIVALFNFLNLSITLPGHRALSGHILSSYSEELQRQHIVEAKKNETESVLITSKGKVLVWGAEDILVKGGKTNDALYLQYQDLPENIAKFLDDNNWWQTIEELESHLLPFMATLNHLQQDAARLPDLDKVFSMTQMRAEINYKRTVEAAKSLEQGISANINTIFSSDNHEHIQTNHKQESSSIIELETNANNENIKMIIEDNLESSANEDIKEGVKELESLFETEETEETANLSSNELLVDLKHPAEDPLENGNLSIYLISSFQHPHL
ncbi:4051_t:CDS:2 [Scutellospora calospora]|uniref:4051_t:CDS:1 n=1 Tax=Scutellospora calospora TaxID=85575 RepID=A0ACA9K2Y4_9GLOM|nr:4051_t:CDS:2 [Scutellospora calospora]